MELDLVMDKVQQTTVVQEHVFASMLRPVNALISYLQQDEFGIKGGVSSVMS